MEESPHTAKKKEKREKETTGNSFPFQSLESQQNSIQRTSKPAWDGKKMKPIAFFSAIGVGSAAL